jgi:hypothetical protein
VLAELERARSVDANVTVESLVTLLEACSLEKTRN